MADQRTGYQRLSRPYFGLNGTASLWAGSDHLIQVTNAIGVERYRRWFYRDIQALVARRTSTRLIWNMVVGLGGLGVGMGALLTRAAPSNAAGDRVGMIIFASILGLISAIFLGVALINTLLGPTCTVFIQTPQGMERLASPGRLAVFAKVVERLRPLVEQAHVQSDSLGVGDRESMRTVRQRT